MSELERSLPLCERLANTVWECLVKNGATTDHAPSREYFIASQGHRFQTEYRFQGNLGFGGKFYRANNKWYVGCYREDDTPERIAIINRTNVALAELRERALGVQDSTLKEPNSEKPTPTEQTSKTSVKGE